MTIEIPIWGIIILGTLFFFSMYQLGKLLGIKTVLEKIFGKDK